jgi:hypothetical protein
MDLPKITLKTDLETHLKTIPLDKFNDIVEGRIYVPKEFRPYTNYVLGKNYDKQLPEQMKLDAYAILVLKYMPLPENIQDQTAGARQLATA